MNEKPDFYEWLYARRPWDESLESALQAYGFEEPGKAWQNLTRIVGHAKFPDLFPDFFPGLLDLLGQSYQSDIALHNFERFSEKIYDKNYLYTILCHAPDSLRVLLTLFSGSQVLTDTLLNDPAHFDWLIQPETLNKPKSRDVLYRDFYAMAGTEDLTADTPSLLRRFKKREYIRIGLRDLMELTDLKENVEDISNLADVCLQVAYEYAGKKLKEKYGTPVYQKSDGEWTESEFAIIGMGKLGGRELNYSSDIDLIYIYTSNMGETRQENPGAVPPISNHEYFTRLGQLVTKTIGEITVEGNVFRVDLNLRPEGQSGEIANSLASSEIYYQSWGRTWERQALIKGRVCAGSEALGKEFFAMLGPFIYRRSFDYEAIGEIKSMKAKIDQSLKQKKDEQGNIKLGFGGIREVEFIVQAYQLLFGGRHRNLRVANTLVALDRLCQQGFLSAENRNRLEEAYIFLRRLENRVQMSFGLQTHSLPRKRKELAVLSRKMNIKAKNEEETVSRFQEAFERHTRFVGNFFAGLFAEKEKREAAETASRQAEDLHGRIDLTHVVERSENLPGSGVDMESGVTLGEQYRFQENEFSLDLMKKVPFTDPRRAFQFLKTLRDGPRFYHPSEKSIRDFYFLLPKILGGCCRVPMPNSAVENLVKFIEASRAREPFLDLLLNNEKFLQLLLILFGSSEVLSQTLIKQPGLMDVLLEMESIYRFKPPEKISGELRGHLNSLGDIEAKKTFLRQFKRSEELRIGIRYLIKETDLSGTLTDLSTVAEVFLDAVLDVAREETRKQYGVRAPALDDFVIFGMGKLGGRELNFGSDLDVIFIYDEPTTHESGQHSEEIVTYYVTLAQMIYQLTSEPTPAGYAYKIDTDLRPEGSGGVLVQSVEGYEKYFRDRAMVWEQQAMTRARFVAGNSRLGEKFQKIAHAFTYRPKLEYSSLIEIARSRERMEKELAVEFKKGKNVKLGFGGLADIEFTVQILLLMHGYRHPPLRQTNTIDALKTLAATGLLDDTVADQLRENYLFLRNVECALRIKEQTSSSYLPKDDAGLAALAKLLGYQGADAGELASNLMKDYDQTTRQVRTFYRKNLDTLLRTSL